MGSIRIPALAQRLRNSGLGETFNSAQDYKSLWSWSTNKVVPILEFKFWIKIISYVKGSANSCRPQRCPICFTSFIRVLMAQINVKFIVRIIFNTSGAIEHRYFGMNFYFALHFIDWKLASVKSFLPNFQEQEFFHAGSPFWPFLQRHFTFW